MAFVVVTAAITICFLVAFLVLMAIIAMRTDAMNSHLVGKASFF